MNRLDFKKLKEIRKIKGIDRRLNPVRNVEQGKDPKLSSLMAYFELLGVEYVLKEKAPKNEANTITEAFKVIADWIVFCQEHDISNITIDIFTSKEVFKKFCVVYKVENKIYQHNDINFKFVWK
jgi:hypothetical protein